MPVRAVLRLIRASVTNAREDPNPRAPGWFLVDGTFDLDFEPENDIPASWNCGLYHEIDVDSDGPPLESQLEFIARSAADDVVSDMREAGYRASGTTAGLAILWGIAPDVRARFSGTDE